MPVCSAWPPTPATNLGNITVPAPWPPRSWLFNSELYVDVEGLARLRQLYQQDGGSEGGQPGGASIVYIPAHKSHLDYLMLRCGTLLRAGVGPCGCRVQKLSSERCMLDSPL